MTIALDSEYDLTDPLIASGKATDVGVELAHEYKEIVDTLAALEKRKEHLRALILQAAEADNPDAKSFPAGDLIIRISKSLRRTVSLTKVKEEQPDLYDSLVASGMVTETPTTSVSVK